MADIPVRSIRPYYTIMCTIGDTDISPYLQRIFISNSILLPYQNVIIQYTFDPSIVISERLDGEKDIHLSIVLTTEDTTFKKSIELDLLNAKMIYPMNNESGGEQHPESSVFTLTCVIKDPFTFMNTAINTLFDRTKKLTPVEMVEQTISKFVPEMKTKILKDNQNEDFIRQFVVPPMTFTNFVRFLDGHDDQLIEQFGNGVGIYNGPMFFQCIYDENTFCMWDLGKIINSAPEYVVYQLALGADDSKIMSVAGTDDKHFYSRSKVTTKDSSNQNIMKNASETNYILKPMDTLYKKQTFKSEDVFSEQSASTTGSSLVMNKTIQKSRINYKSLGESGNEDSTAVFTSRLSRSFSNMSEIQFNLDRNLAIEKLTRVGIPILFEPQIVEYMPYQGTYITDMSVISFNKADTDTWVCNATIRAFRGNLRHMG